jgi:hypothetical protein
MLVHSPAFRLVLKALVLLAQGHYKPCSRASAGGFRLYALYAHLLSRALTFKAYMKLTQGIETVKQ